jgi:hypothetical protein
MTTQECDTRDKRMIDNIQSVLSVHERLRQYAAALQVSIENATIVLRGELPTIDLKAELIPAVRRAGVLSQVCDCVKVAG